MRWEPRLALMDFRFCPESVLDLLRVLHPAVFLFQIGARAADVELLDVSFDQIKAPRAV